MINRLQQFLINLDTIKLSRILTLFFILVHFQGLINRYPMIAIPTLIFATIGLIFPEARDKKFLWAGISTSFTIYIFLNWQLIDNHIYLWGYWLLANVLSLFSRTPDETLKFSAKFLLMSCMLFAVYQKVNPSYLSGDFFLLYITHRPAFLFY